MKLFYPNFNLGVFRTKQEEVKDKLYELGAEFALMSGSGASVFGIFKKRMNLSNNFPKEYFTWIEKEKG